MNRSRKNGRVQNLFNASVMFIILMVIFSIAVNVLTETHASPPALTEELSIISVAFSQGNAIDLVVNNSGTLDSGIAEVWINNEKQAFTISPPIGTFLPDTSIYVLVACSYTNGTNYDIKIISNRGNVYLATASAL